MLNEVSKEPCHNPIMVDSLPIHSDVPLREKNWFRTGGNAQFFCQPTSQAQYVSAVSFAQQHNLPTFVLGHGANILVSDEGFKGLVIQPQLRDLTIKDYSDTHVLVTAGAGVCLKDLISFCLTNNASGMEEFSGIPGTVGGSVYINVHYFEYLLSHFLDHATVIHKETGVIQTVPNAWFNFGYNQSTLQQKEHHLLDATFKLKKISRDQALFAQGRSYEIIRYRNSRYPTQNTCGSFFRNFLPHEIPFEINGKKIIYVAYYLDKLGVKGSLAAGSAAVSHQHANMIVTMNNATSSDVIAVAREMQTKLFDGFGIIAQTECELVGFTTHPLKK